MHVEIVNVTPDMASQWLQKNVGNRKIKPLIVNRYTKDLQDGGWAQTHQGIAFDKEGNLADGQHRLTAIVNAGVSIDMVVTWGVQRHGIDRLAPRSELDEIKYAGMSDWISGQHLHVANAMLELATTRQRKAERTTAELVAFCNNHKEAIVFTKECFKTNEKFIAAAIVKGAVAIASEHESKERVRQFVEILYSGMPEGKADFMAVRARDFLMKGGAKGGATDRRKAAKAIMRAIYLFCRGESLSRLQPPSEYIYQPEEK